MESTDKSSILRSIFKRNGGEGEKTKIIMKENVSQKQALYKDILEENEKALIIYYNDNASWVLYTNKRIIVNYNGYFSLDYHDIVIDSRQIMIAKQLEHKYQTVQIQLKDKNGKIYTVPIESGEPFKGILQMLYFLEL